MKKFTALLLASFLFFSGCSFGDKKPTEKEVTQPTAANNNLYETEKFSFEYPSAWQKQERGDSLFDTGSDGYTFSYYDGDIMGPRCVKTISEKTFTDNAGKEWNYSIEMPSKTEICEKPTVEQLKERTAVADVAQQDSGFLALLFFTYNVDNETTALRQFETILSSSKVK